jgi:hypothetical protein
MLQLPFLKSMDPVFIEKYSAILAERQAPSQNQQCLLWTGAVKKCGRHKTILYGCITCKIAGNWKTVSVHRLKYVLDHGVHLDTIQVEGFDISHICHNTLCINPLHLVFEPHRVNNNRQRCKNKQICFGHENRPRCLLNLLIPGTFIRLF